MTRYIVYLASASVVLVLGCGDSDDHVVEPPPTALEAVVLGTVVTGGGDPVAGAAVEVEAWQDGCGSGVPITPSADVSQLTTDANGQYTAVLRSEGESFVACVSVEAESPPVYHLLPAAEAGVSVAFNPSSMSVDTARVDLTPSLDLPIHYASISAGGVRTCGLSTNGGAFCWGRVNTGQVGDGLYPEPSAVPVPVDGGVAFTALATNGGHSCGLDGSGAAFCWGGNPHGELGIGTVTLGSLTPLSVDGGYTFESVTAGASFSCGTTTDDIGLCWGNNFVGQLGAGSDVILIPFPTSLSGDLRFTQISGGANATSCGASDLGDAYCWGVNWMGSLGDGLPPDPEGSWSLVPVAVVGGHSFWQVATGAYFACGLDGDGRAHCWGDNEWGQVGDGTTQATSSPVEVVATVPFVAVAAGNWHACGLTAGGHLYCWGRNDYGQLGDGTLVDRSVPTRVQTEETFTGLAAGENHTCAVNLDDDLYCWGKGENGQLGTGTLDDQPTPVPVVDPQYLN